MFEKLTQRNRRVVLGVVGRIDESDMRFLGGLHQGLPSLRMCLQLEEVATPKLIPTSRIVAEPFAQLRAGGDVLQPRLHGEGFLFDTSWPQTFHQEARAVVAGYLLVSTFDRNVSSSLHTDILARVFGRCPSLRSVSRKPPSPVSVRATAAMPTRRTPVRVWHGHPAHEWVSKMVAGFPSHLTRNAREVGAAPRPGRAGRCWTSTSPSGVFARTEVEGVVES
jgi:hypothetical protein